MAQRFRGESLQKVDAKGRVSVPAPFRRVIEAGDPAWSDGLRPNFVIVYGTQRQQFLECYTMASIAEIDRRIARMPLGSKDRRMLERIYQSFAMPTQVDEDGRIVLPQKLRDKLAIGAEAFFIAAGDRFEVWKPDTYAAEVGDEAEEWLDQMPEGFDPRALLPDLPEEA